MARSPFIVFSMRTFVFGLVALVALHANADAQPSGQAAGDSRRWEVEWYGGLSAPNPPSRGTTTLPAAGAPLPTSSPAFPSRQIPSWFFGDGALLLNDVNAAFGLSNRISPLDAGLEASAFDAGRRVALGIRARRAMSPAVSLELSVGAVPGAKRQSDALLAAADSSRESFEAAIRALLSSGPFSNVVVSATRETSDGSARELFATAALNIHFRRHGSFVPYVTAGGGITTGAGTAPSITVEGTYRFDIGGVVPVDETDRVTIRVERDTTFVAVAGGGVRKQMSRRWGFRADGRVFVGSGGHSVRIDSAPSSVSAAPAGFVESFTHPSVQFSNHASTGRQSTLSAPALQGFSVFDSDGIGTRVLVTVGLVARF